MHFLSLPFSLSLSHTHTHKHTHLHALTEDEPGCRRPNKALSQSDLVVVISFQSDSHRLCSPPLFLSSRFLCSNPRAEWSAKLLGFSVFGAFLFCGHECIVGALFSLASVCMCVCVRERERGQESVCVRV